MSNPIGRPPRGGRGAIYRRNSKRDADPARQHTTIRLWLDSHGLTVPPEYVFEDAGGRRGDADRIDRRPAWHRLLTTVDARLIDWIAIESHERLGYKDKYQFMAFLYRFREAGVELIEAKSGRILTDDDVATFLIASMGAHQSQQELIELATRSQGEKREMATAGLWPGGWIMYGTQVECRDPAGVPLWRVEPIGKWVRRRDWLDGRPSEIFEGPENFPARQKYQTLHVIPSGDATRLAVVRYCFEEFGDNPAATLNGLATTLNARRTYHTHGPWAAVYIRALLANPVWIGRPAYNKSAHGSIVQFDAEGRVVVGTPRNRDPAKARAGRPQTGRRRPRSEWMMPDRPLFAPVVPVELYERVRARLEDAKAPVRRRRSDDATLSGLVYCGRCGTRMVFWSTPNDRGCKRSYCCGEYRRFGKAAPHGCRLHRTSADLLEKLVEQYLAETDQTIAAVAEAGPNGLIGLMYREKGELVERLATLRARMEATLLETLPQIADPERLPDGRLRYSFDGEFERITVDLPSAPGVGFAGLNDVVNLYGAVAARREAVAMERRAKLTAELEGLVRSWPELPGETAKRIAGDRIRVIEAELVEVRRDSEPLAREAARTVDLLLAQQVKIQRARKERRTNPARRREAVGRVIERIVCHHEYSQHGQQTRSHLVRVEVLPMLPGSERGEYDFRDLALRAPG